MATMTNEEVMNELARLKAENEALKKASTKTNRLTLKVSEKGAVSLYGMGRFPVTLYQEQWATLFGAVDMVKGFIESNKALLKTKE